MKEPLRVVMCGAERNYFYPFAAWGTMLDCRADVEEAVEPMDRKHQNSGLQAALLAAAMIAFAPMVWADSVNAQAASNANDKTINLAGLSAVLRAASDRKQSGDEVTLKNDIYLQGRPTGDNNHNNVLHAGTVVRQSKNHVVNATGTWRHVETRDGNDGWVHELDLEP